MNVRLSLGKLWNMGQWARTAGWCIVFLGLLGVSRAEAAENPVATQTTLVAATSNAGPRTRVTLTAHVTATAGSPVGVVNFRAGELDLGSAIVNAEGVASLQTDSLPAGTHQIVAVYKDQSGGLMPSISKPEVVRAEVTTVAGFTIAASTTTLSTVVGGYVNSTITVTPNNGFNGYVSLSCDGLPINTTCTFTPLAVQATCTGTTCPAASSIMQIQTLAPSPSTTAQNGGDQNLPRFVIIFPALFGIAGLGACKRRTWRNVALGLVTIAGVLGMSSCAQRYRYLNHGPPNNPGTPVGTYTVTIEAQSSTGSQTTTPPTEPQLTLTVTAPKS
jgi:hypothetical protein